MDLRGYLAALRKGWWVILSCTALGLIAGVLSTSATKPVYQCIVTFYVSTPLGQDSNIQSAGSYAQARVNSYVGLLSSELVAERVKTYADIDLPVSTIQSSISATAELNTVLVTAEIRDTDKSRCTSIAAGVSNVFPQLADELDNQSAEGDSTTPAVVVKVITGPQLNPDPISPRPAINILLGVAAGGALGVILSLARHLTDTAVRSAATVTALTGAPVLAKVPFDPHIAEVQLVSGEGATSARGEAIRQLRTNLRFVDIENVARVVAVTSAIPNEGKTTTAVNLAISLAETGESVLLVGGDLRNPAICEPLGLTNSVGLTDVVLGDQSLEHVVQRWGTSTLFVLSSGETPPNPTEILASDSMRALISVAGSAYDRVIIDCAPLLPVADGAVMAALADGTLLVVREGFTKRAQLAEARQSIRTVRGRLLGSVLILRKRSKEGNAGYYGYEGEQIRYTREIDPPSTLEGERVDAEVESAVPQRASTPEPTEAGEESGPPQGSLNTPEKAPAPPRLRRRSKGQSK